MESRPPMTLLTSVAGSFRAHVLFARLEAEGIDAQLRGAMDGAYGFTMGDLARVDVFVPEEQLDDATYVMLSDEVDAALAAPAEWGTASFDADDAGGANARARWLRWVAVTLLVVAIGGFLLGALLRATN